MSEGHDWSEPPFAVRVFRPHYWKCVAWLSIFYLVVGIAVSVFLVLQGVLSGDGWPTASTALILLLFCVLFPFPISSLLCTVILMYRFEVTPTTVSCPNAWGVRTTIPLDSVIKVTHPWYGYGLFAVVKSSVGKAIWVPRVLIDRDDLTDCLLQVTTKENPLYQYFLER